MKVNWVIFFIFIAKLQLFDYWIILSLLRTVQSLEPQEDSSPKSAEGDTALASNLALDKDPDKELGLD